MHETSIALGKTVVRIAAGAAIVVSVVLCACGRKPAQCKKTFFRMDTVVEVTVAGESMQRASKIWVALDSLLKDWEERFSQTHARSEVLRLNERKKEELDISARLAEMLAIARAYGDTLQGGFDVTILPVKQAWGFGEKDSALRIPTPEELTETLSKVGYERLDVDIALSRVRFHDPELRVDVGGVAKGFVLREIEKLLDDNAFGNYLVSAGGDIVSRGSRADGEPWRIGIQHPRASDRLLATLALDSGAIVTSGDYERFWIQDSVRYHHIFNSKTGRSCRANQSLTVWATEPVRADILSTGLFCLPAPQILEFVNTRDGLECAVVDSSGSVHISSGWKSAFKLIHEN